MTQKIGPIDTPEGLTKELARLEKGEITFDQFPEDVQARILENPDDAPLIEPVDAPEATPSEPAPAPVDEPKPVENPEEPAPAPDEDNGPKTLAERLAATHVDKNRYKQKYEALERKLHRLETDPEFLKTWGQERKLPIGTDPAVMLQMAQMQAKLESMEQRREEKETSRILQPLMQEMDQVFKDHGVDIGESFDAADAKYAEVYNHFNGSKADIDRFQNDEEFRKEHPGLEMPKDPDGYFKMARAVSAMNTANLDLGHVLDGMGFKKKVADTPPTQNPRALAEANRLNQRQDEPLGIPEDLGAPPENTTVLERFALITQKINEQGMDAQLSPEEQAILTQVLEADLDR